MTDTTVKQAAPAVATRTRLLLKGPVVPTMLRIATPNLAVNVILIAVTASVDAHFVGYLGLDALAGLALVFPFLMLMQQMANMAMGGAIAASVARTLGAGRTEEARALACHALVIATGAAALFSAAFLLGGPELYRLLGERGPVLAAALEYSNVIFAGAIAYWLLGALTSIVRGTGHAAILAWVYIAAEALHIALVPLLVFGWGPFPALGITGAGLATVISFLASATALAIYLASGRTAITLSFTRVRFERRLFAEILKVGAPMSLAPVLNNAALAALTTYAGVLGATSLAAFGAAVRLEYLLYPLNFSMGAAVLAMMGSSIGAKQFGRAARIAWIGLALSAGAMACVSLVAIVGPGLWMGLFSHDLQILADGALYLAIVGLAYPFVAGTLLNSAFQSTRQPQWPLVAMGSRLAVVVLGGWIAVEILQTGLVGIAVVTALGLVTMGGVLIGAFRFFAKLG
ncbi:MATE family efflux transporter [Reyranella soli]|uniref:Multidrug-efflux transporter n=1 Tax=Reyranella soli TaxID=1230389 RepID=A0A512NID1_9HYPH|nr:MATE family efflux transporter [Reyranella soli]GEP58672.1 MATE family efflux transporter [Reyranella soli]